MKPNRTHAAISILEHAVATGMCSPILEHIGIDLLIAALQVAAADDALAFAEDVGDGTAEPSRRLKKWRAAYRFSSAGELNEELIRAALNEGFSAVQGKTMSKKQVFCVGCNKEAPPELHRPGLISWLCRDCQDSGFRFAQGGFVAAPMSLRDYFAGQALAGMLAKGTQDAEEDVARYAYGFADAMMAERAEAKPTTP